MGKTTLSEAEAKAFVVTAFGPATGFRRLTEGEDSQAFAFDAAGEFVLRINRNRDGFDRDRFACERFGQRLPIPEVILIAPIADAWACVSHRIAGVTLQDLPPGGAGLAAADVARVLDTMAACDLRDMGGAGPLDPTGRSLSDSWGHWLMQIADRDWQLVPEMIPVVQTVRDRARLCPDHRHLVHGDFGSNNVLVRGNAVTGVIDWSEAMVGDPRYDLANILFWRTWLTCMDEQAAFFETHQPWRLADAETLGLYQLRIGLDVLWQAVRDGDDRLAAWTRTRIGAIRAGMA